MPFRYAEQALTWAMHKICLIHTSVSCLSEAQLIADTLIGLKLCACVQVSGPGNSTYRWHGSVEQAEEYYLNIKTNGARKREVLDWLHVHHPYDLPEISWIFHDCSEQYAQWVDSAVA